MTWTLTCQKFLGSLALLIGLVGHTLAQSITVSGNIAPSTNLCAGSAVQLTFSTSGTFTSGNTFSLQRSDENGAFATTPTVLGTLAAVPTSATTLTVSGTLDAGVINATGYRFRVVSSNPVRTSNPTPNAVTIGVAPPDASPASACQNSGNLTLSATGQNIEWYNTAGATVPNGTGATYAVSTASSNIYYVTQTVNGCKSAKRSVVVTINNRPGAPTVNGAQNGSSSYCPGAGGQLTAAGAPGAIFRWTNNRNSTVATTSTINAPSETTSYTVTQTVNGCESANFATFTATVNSAPNTPTLSINNVNTRAGSYCNGTTPPSLQVTNVGSGNTVIWTRPDGTTSTSNPLVGTLAGTYSVVQRNTATGCTSNPETAIVTINPTPGPPTLNSAGPFCQFSGNGNVQPITANGQGIEWFSDLSGGTKVGEGTSFTVSTATASPDPVVYLRQTVSGCPSSITAISVTVNSTPSAPTTISYPTNYCANDAGGQSRLSVTLSGGANGQKWYNLTDNTTSTDATLAAPGRSTRYQVTQSINGCESGRSAEFTVNVKRNPDAPTITGQTTFCQNSGVQTVTAQGEANSTIEWFDNLTSVNVRSSTNSYTVSTAVADPDPVVYFQQRVDGCASLPRTSQSITVNPTPGKPSVSGSYTACQNAQAGTLSSAVTNGQGLRFFEGGTERAGSYRPATDTPGSSTTFAVTQTIAGCQGPTETLTLTVKRKPDQPKDISSPSFCQNYTPSSLSAAVEAGAALRWIYNGTENVNPPVVPNNEARTYPYQVLQILDGCRSDPASLAVTVNPTPGAPNLRPLAPFCQDRQSQPLAAEGERLQWYDSQNRLLPDAPTPPTSATGAQQYAVTQANSFGCVSPKRNVNLTVYRIPGLPDATPPNQYCSGDAAKPLSATGDNLLWYTSLTGGTASANAIIPVTTSNPAGATALQTYYVTQTQNGCESNRKSIEVTIKRKPSLPTNVPNNLSFCQNYPAPALTATPETNASIVWRIDNGTYVPTVPTVPNSQTGVLTYQVAQTLNDCRSDDASFQVRVKPTPGQPTITPFSLCQGRGTRTLQASGNDLKYYDASNNLIGTTAPSPSTDQAITLTYRVSQSTDGCEGPKIDYPVIVYPIPAQPGVSNLTYCLTQTDQPAQDVRPLTAAGQNLRWYNTDNNSFPSAPTPSINALIDATYLVTQTVNNCESERARLNVKVVTTTTPVVPASVLTYCRNDPSSPIVVTAPVGSTLVWTGPDGFTFPQVPGGQGPTPPTINATKGGEQYRVYAIGTNGCYSARAFIGLVVNTNPTATISGSTTVNYGQTATLRLRFTSQPPYSYTLTDGTTGTATDTLATVAVRPLQTTLYQVASVSNVCGGGQPVSSATVSVTIPTITTQALTGSNTLCAGTSFVVGYGTTGTFNQGNGFKVQIADTTSKNYIDVSGVTPGSPLTANLPANLRSGLYFVRVLATNPGAEVPGQVSPTLLTVKGLPGATLTGTQNVYETYPASLTIALSGSGPWAVTYQATDEQPVSFNTSATPHIVTVRPAKTTTYQLVSVSNDCASTTALSGTAVVTVLPLLAVENPLTGALSLFPVPTQNVLTVAIDLPLTAQQPAELTLNDLTGRPVLTRTTQARQTQLDLSQQPAGLYLLNVQVGDKRVVRKVMKL